MKISGFEMSVMDAVKLILKFEVAFLLVNFVTVLLLGAIGLIVLSVLYALGG